MQLDLRKSAKTLRNYIAERVRDYPVYIHEGPGKDNAPIKQVTVGYQFDQSGWAALVFDTRPNAEIDGEWNSYIEPNELEFADWQRVFDEFSERGTAIKLTLPDGKKRTLDDDVEERLAEILGECVRDVLVAARDDGLFATLPTAADCMFVVEEQGGRYGWTDRKDDDTDSEKAYLAHLDGNVRSKSKPAQLEHWINVLERIASGKEAAASWSFVAPAYAFEHLEKFGDRAVVPLLKFVRKWASKPEWEGDRPSRKLAENPMQTPAVRAIQLVAELSAANSEVETLLTEIVRRSVAVNRSRKLWGIIPYWAAYGLAKLFDGYPEPKRHSATNALLNPNEYVKPRQAKR